MRLSSGQQFSYCLNVHPGEGLEDMMYAIRTHVPVIRAALCPDAPFGLGLRVAHQASETLRNPAALAQLCGLLEEQNLYAFTINGFPYGAFHQTRVKETVYLPDWSSPERLAYTRRLFHLLAGLIPEGEEGSISTVPLGYKFASTRPEDTVEPLRSLGRDLARLEQETGRRLHLGLEPEPDCLLETTQETVQFFEDTLFAGTGAEEAILRRHLGVCLDTCHVAMQFEDPAESLQSYRQAGIRVSKIQLSAALECAADTDPARLCPFDDGVYLHQVKTEPGGSLRDLPDWIANPDPGAGTLRIHAHVPLHWPGDEQLGTTRHTLTEAFWQEVARGDCPHLEVETYTFDVLPQAVRGDREVAENMIAECEWALKKILI